MKKIRPEFIVPIAMVILAIAMVIMFPAPKITGHGSYDNNVQPGQTILVKWKLTKTTTCPGLYSRTWTGEGGYYLSEGMRSTNIPLSDNDVYRVATLIPSTAPIGHLQLVVSGYYECSHWRKYKFKLEPVILIVE